MKSVARVHVPATSGNMGPGFDTLGVALRLYNCVEVRLHDQRCAKDAPSSPMAAAAARAFFRKAAVHERGFSARIRGDVPASRGLGSSVTVRLGVAAGLNHLLGSPLGRAELLDLVSDLEGHPDNAAPAVFGGIAAAGVVEGRVMHRTFKAPPSLRFVAAIPDFEMETRRARKILPASAPLADCVHNLSRVALMIALASQGDFRGFGRLLEDRLHQPYRAKLVPQLYPALDAARAEGAYGGWLSGSGSTIMAITRDRPREVGRAMARVFAKSRARCRVLILAADPKGMRIEG